MIGFTDSENTKASRETDTDEEVLVTGRLPICTSPTQFAGYMPPAQELPTTHITHKQEESEAHSSHHSVSTGVYLDIIPAEHWYIPNWRSTHFSQSMPNGVSNSSCSNLDVSSSGGSSSEVLEQQPPLKRKCLRKHSNCLVTPHREVSEMQQPLPPLAQLGLSTQSPPAIQPPRTQPSALEPDYVGLHELYLDYNGHPDVYLEQRVQEWAQGHCQTGDVFAGEEIIGMSQLARQTPMELGWSLWNSHSICLQRCPDIATADIRLTRWRMVATVTENAATFPVVAAQGNTEELGEQNTKEKRPTATYTFARYQPAGSSILEDLVKNNVVVLADSANNWPSMTKLVAMPFVPILFRTHKDEPAHCIVNSRITSGLNKTKQAQGFHEYGLDNFSVPVVHERWLEYQRQKYRQWCDSLKDDRIVQTQVSNAVETVSCQNSPILGPAMCRGCVTRQTDSQCRFRYIRVNTRLDVTMRDRSKFTRYIAAPMFASQADSASMALVVKPAPVSLVMVELSGEDGSATTPAGWSELYSLFMTAPTLLKALSVIASVIVEDSSTTPLTSLEYGVLPEYGCSAAPCIYRTISPGFRQVCDMCATSIMSVCFTCCMCATEMCVDCFSEWDDNNFKPRVLLGQAANKGVTRKVDDGSNGARRFNRCKQPNRKDDPDLHLQSQHKKCQFMRVSQFSAADINQVMEKVKSVVSLDDIYPAFSRISSAGVISDAMAQAFAAKIELIEKRTREMYPHEPWELPVLYVQPDELTTAEFSCLWRRGVVVVVRGLLPVLNSEIWQPEWWIKNFGSEIVGILDCADGAKPVGGAWPLRNFYRLFDGPDKYSALFGEEEQKWQSQPGDEPKAADGEWEKHKACVERGILKLKDWPPTEDFEARLPDHFRHFMRALPFPEYTQRLGQFNLVNRLPTEFVPPDLGPKMYCAYGSSDGEGGVGTTNLHCDMADAVNIMAYAPPEFLRERGIEVPGIWTRSDDSPSSSTTTTVTANADAPAAAAVWDIYPPEAMSDLRKFIGNIDDIFYSAECSGPAAAKHGDPIHNQETFLTHPMRQLFFEKYHHSCYRIYQNPGDAVFVPAGCAHQVCNYSSAIKVAMDFVSPERVEHCRRLTGEFRQLDSKHPRRLDLLQLGNILWWTFAGKQELSSKRPRKQVKQSATESGSGSKT